MLAGASNCVQDRKSMEPRIFFFFLLLLLSSTPLPSSTLANETDRMALLAFKDQITDAFSTVLRLWNDSISYCDWEGVSCSRKHPGRVAALDLASRDLVGSISPSIGNLTFLRRVHLGSNGFYGEIPSDIGRLSRLQYLNLSFNSLHGAIPVNLTRCAELRTLSSRFNQLTGRIPVEFGSLLSLGQLDLSNNNLTGNIPSSLGNISSLAVLNLRLNQLEGSIPDAFGNLAGLGHLQVYGNMLSGTIPPSLFNLSSLNFFSAAVNRLQGRLPSSMGNTIPSLQVLYLGDNQLNGHVPPSLPNASTLQAVDLGSNNFSGYVPSDLGRLRLLSKLSLGFNQLELSDANDWRFLDSLTNCSNLQYLLIEDNRIAGMLPNSIANLSAQLQFLNVAYNQISGNIPSGIQNLVSLVELDMGHNLLNGEIPQGIGKLSKLQKLTMFNNRFTGDVPSSLGNLTQLITLYLFGNNLHGPLPPSIGNLQQLRRLALSNNSINGSIPKEMFSLSYLSDFIDLSNNFLSGSLPSEVGNMKNLGQLDVSGNKLSGEIPYTLGYCEVLELLSLHNNFFEGAIPQSLGNLKGLRLLYLSRNRLSGSIPPSFGSIEGLEELDLSYNNLSGSIPKSLENLDALFYVDLSFNHIHGDVPTKGAFGNLTAISLLGNDGLCGGIPGLHLPACPTIASHKRRGLSQSLKIVITIISVAVCLLLLASSAFLIWRQKSGDKTVSTPSVSPLEVIFPKISYGELVKATHEFSPANLIGRGRYGTVYKGIMREDNEVVAVKVFDLQEQGASKSFVSECEALGSIRHRNLMKILTCCSSIDNNGNDFKALVYSFMPNGSLDACLHPGEDVRHEQISLSLIQRLNIAIDVGDALEYLHHDCQPPVVHCDLKPSNILLDGNMNARVGDFGLARILTAIRSKSPGESSSTIEIRGTIGYVAPEYGVAGQASICGDVYSYGILLLEMITGKRPTDGMFKDGLTLRSFVEMGASPERVMEIADPLMFSCEDEDLTICKETGGPAPVRKIQDCLLSVAQVGLSCSLQSPNERMNMMAVATKMHAIRDAYLRVRNQGDTGKWHN